MSDRHETLVDAATVAAHHADSDWVVVDVRFMLADASYGRAQWEAATVPGARFADLDRDLSAPVQPGVTGRHPLPSPETFAATLGRWGITPASQVVAFDQMGGAFAARLWWMLRWVGHRAVAVLDGGWDAWTDGGHPVAAGQVSWEASAAYPVRVDAAMTVDAATVAAAHDDDAVAVFDARGADRYRGENETTDPVAGHIPGADSVPFADNFAPGKRMRDAQQLRARFETALAGRDPARAIAYCGSGVTACHDLLAMTHAGLPMPRLYPGSWSEWIVDPARARATGPDRG